MATKKEAVGEFLSKYYLDLSIAQFTIDMLEAITCDLFSDRDFLNDPITRDEVLSWCYDIDTAVEVMDKVKFKIDVDLLVALNVLIRDWGSEIEQNNILLGIPKEKG